MSILYEFDPTAESIEARQEVPSPCINICKMDDKTALCVGCYRTIQEITAWRLASNENKLAIWQEIKVRMFAEP